MARGSDPSELAWRLPFRARITGQSTVSGLRRYTWVEQSIDPDTGDTEDASWPREGTSGTNWALELNNADVANDTIVTMRFRCMVAGVPVFEFADPTGGGGGGSITVEDDDGTPSYSSITTLQFDGDDRFTVSNPSAGVAKVRLARVGVENTSSLVSSYNDVVLENGSGTPADVYVWSNALGAVFTGFTGGVDGRRVYLFGNNSSSQFAINHDSGSSSAANRVLCPMGVNYGVGPYQGVTIAYSGILSRWLVITSRWKAAPGTATSYGVPGDMAYDSSYFYICTAASTWKRVAIASW